MLPTPATRRWSSSHDRIGEMDRERSACNRRAVKLEESGQAKESIAHGPFRLVHRLQRSKAAHVVVDEDGPRAQGKAYGGVGRPCLVLGQHEAAGHTQVHDQDRIPCEARNDVLPSPVNGFEYPAPQAGGKVR